MLDLLVQYAKTHDLAVDPGFAAKTVRWAIVLDPASGSLNVLELGDTEAKRNPGETFQQCPDLTQPELVGGSESRCHFLVETTEVVALYGEKARDVKTQAKHAYFVRLLRGASEAVPQLGVFADRLSDPATLEGLAAELVERKAKPTDKITLAVLGRHPPCVVEWTGWHDWWRDFRARLAPQPGKGRRADAPQQMRSVVTGELVEPCATHPKIRGLAGLGGLAMGDALVCFDKDAFQSYGLAQSANAAMSERVATAYRSALNALIRERGHILAGAMVVHWFKSRVEPEDDPVAFLIEAQQTQELTAQQRARRLLDAVRTGQRPDLAGNHYYALTISGAAGRVMVRDWMEGQFEQLVENVSKWFGHLSIVHRRGGGLAPAPKFLAVLGATVRDLKELPPPFVARMWRVAVCGEAIPQQALAEALHRIKIGVIEDDPLSHAGMGLLRAYHVRKGDSAMEPILNENHPAPAYQCGRLMAVLARVQHAALGDVGAGLVQRYYAAASTTPALRLGQLTKLSQFHLNKLDPGLAHWFESKIAAIWAQIRDRLPKTLSLEEQSLFALGYYQQMAADRTKPATTPDKETDDE